MRRLCDPVTKVETIVSPCTSFIIEFEYELSSYLPENSAKAECMSNLTKEWGFPTATESNGYVRDGPPNAVHMIWIREIWETGENQILNYTMVQIRLLPLLAATFALHFTGRGTMFIAATVGFFDKACTILITHIICGKDHTMRSDGLLRLGKHPRSYK